MPLRCVDERGSIIEAPDCSEEEWESLRERARKERNLRMPCCPAHAVLKTSKLGTRFFAHKAKDACDWKRETEEHLHLKALALAAARKAGWEAQSEVTGYTPDGEKWTADVLAWKGDEKIAIEIQWSGQTNEKTWHRQRRYERSGVKGIWLLRQPGFPIHVDLPAGCIGGSMEEGLRVLVPQHEGATARDRKDDYHWLQDVSPEEFVKAVFEGRFLFGTEHARRVSFEINTGVMECWKCKSPTRIVTWLSGRTGPHTRDMQYIQLVYISDIPKLEELVRKATRLRPDIGAIKERYSHRAGYSYLSNGCMRCDAIVGRAYERYAFYVQEETVGTMELEIDQEARKTGLFESDRWGIWTKAQLENTPVEAEGSESEETWECVAVEGARSARVRTSPVHPLRGPEFSSPADSRSQENMATRGQPEEKDDRPGFRIREDTPTPRARGSSRGSGEEPSGSDQAPENDDKAARAPGLSIESDFQLPGQWPAS